MDLYILNSDTEYPGCYFVVDKEAMSVKTTIDPEFGVESVPFKRIHEKEEEQILNLYKKGGAPEWEINFGREKDFYIAQLRKCELF